MHHVNIVDVHELYIDNNNKKVYTILEYIEGKEMYEAIKSLGHYSGI